MEITIHRALAQLKTTLSRAEKINTFISFTKGQSGLAGGETVDVMSSLIKSNFESKTSLLKNYKNLKLAIIRSNSGITADTTNIRKLTVDGEDYTTAEIIALNVHVMPLYKNFISQLSMEYSNVSSIVERNNNLVDSSLPQIMSTIFKDKTALTKEEIENLQDSYKKSNYTKFVDPLDLPSKIKELTEWYDRVLVEIDSALSESNALTKINVDF